MESNAAVEFREDWREWCRVCGKRSTESTNVVKFESSINFASILQLYFSIDLAELKGDESNICSECKDFLVSIEQFNEKCKKVHEMFVKIISSSGKSQRDEIGIDFDVQIPHIETIEILPECQVKIEHIDVGEYQCNNEPNDEETQGINEDIETPKEFGKTEASRVGDIEVGRKADTTESGDENADEEINFDDDNNMDSSDDNVSSCDTESESANKQTAAKREHPSGSQVHRCLICNKTFHSRRALSVHNRNVHPENARKFRCSKCSKCFAYLAHLLRHERIHLPDEMKRVHPCEFCGKRFTQSSNVKIHIRQVHTTEKPVVCEHCGKAFTIKKALDEHQVVHSDEYPFKCDKCSKQFKLRCFLRKHEEVHDVVS